MNYEWTEERHQDYKDNPNLPIDILHSQEINRPYTYRYMSEIKENVFSQSIPMENTLLTLKQNETPSSPASRITYLRAQSQQRFKEAWESIIEKYSKDFSNETDIIDLETGEIIESKGFVDKLGVVEFGGGNGISSEEDDFSNHEDENSEDEDDMLMSLVAGESIGNLWTQSAKKTTKILNADAFEDLLDSDSVDIILNKKDKRKNSNKYRMRRISDHDDLTTRIDRSELRYPSYQRKISDDFLDDILFRPHHSKLSSQKQYIPHSIRNQDSTKYRSKNRTIFRKNTFDDSSEKSLRKTIEKDTPLLNKSRFIPKNNDSPDQISRSRPINWSPISRIRNPSPLGPTHIRSSLENIERSSKFIQRTSLSSQSIIKDRPGGSSAHTEKVLYQRNMVGSLREHPERNQKPAHGSISSDGDDEYIESDLFLASQPSDGHFRSVHEQVSSFRRHHQHHQNSSFETSTIRTLKYASDEEFDRHQTNRIPRIETIERTRFFFDNETITKKQQRKF